LPPLRDERMGAAMTQPSPLDDPDQAAFAWARYRRLMTFMGLVTTLTVVGAMVLLYRSGALVSIHFVIATALGIGVMMMLTAALMGLVFLSHGTGHDAAVARTDDDEPEYRGPRP
jgi:fatty acid desaturase